MIVNARYIPCTDCGAAADAPCRESCSTWRVVVVRPAIPHQRALPDRRQQHCDHDVTGHAAIDPEPSSWCTYAPRDHEAATAVPSFETVLP